MDIVHIAELAEQLESLGFKELGSALLKRICFRPVAFTLLTKHVQGGDHFLLQLYFQHNEAQDIYVWKYFDATLQVRSHCAELVVGGVNISDLQRAMGEINWQQAFELDLKKRWAFNDKPSWEKESQIESVMIQLRKLEALEQGKNILAALKLEYWFGLPYHNILGEALQIKTKGAIAQRFYVSSSQVGISVDEACRFLRNKWVEKQEHLRRKSNPNSDEVIEARNNKKVLISTKAKKHKKSSGGKESNVFPID